MIYTIEAEAGEGIEDLKERAQIVADKHICRVVIVHNDRASIVYPAQRQAKKPITDFTDRAADKIVAKYPLLVDLDEQRIDVANIIRSECVASRHRKTS